MSLIWVKKTQAVGLYILPKRHPMTDINENACASNLLRGGRRAEPIDDLEFELRGLFCHFGRAVSRRPCSKCRRSHGHIVPLPRAQFHLFAESPRGAGGEEEIVRKWRNGDEIMASRGGGVLVSRRGTERPRPDLSVEADHHHRAGVAGGRDRYARAHPGAALQRRLGRPNGGREQAGRQQPGCRGICDAPARRRLHAVRRPGNHLHRQSRRFTPTCATSSPISPRSPVSRRSIMA